MQTLMNKKHPVMEIELDGNTIKATGRVLNQTMMPIQLQRGFTLETLNQWFTGRLIPEKREGLKEARSRFPGIEKDKFFFSLSDQYWVRHSTRDSWEKQNFFTNAYSEGVGKAFFTPWNVTKEEIIQPSPDRTTNGMLKKRWVRGKDGTSYLVKAASEIYHQEPLSEVLASIMLKKLDIIKFVPYELVIDGLSFCSKCPNFITESTEFVPAAAIYKMEPAPEKTSTYDHLIKMCAKAGIPGAKEYLDNMITADHILCNFDRHLGNFGFIRSADNGAILGFAPLFDLGSSYWGTSDKIERKPSRLFADIETEVVKKMAKRGKLAQARTTAGMTELVKKYPYISAAKKEGIIGMMKDVDLEMEKISGSVLNEKEIKSMNDLQMEIEYT